MIEDAGRTVHEFSRDRIEPPQMDAAWKRDSLEAPEVPAYYKRRSAGVWAALASVVVALVAVAGYGDWLLQQQNIQLEQLPGVVKSLPELNQHIVNTANLLNATRSDQQNLAAHLSSVDAGANEALERTRQQMSALIAQMQRRLASGVNQSTGALQAQISGLVSQQSSYQSRLVQLEAELGQARSDLASTQKEYAQELASLRAQQTAQDRALSTLAASLPTRQVFFQLQKNQARDIAPGMSFHLTKTDVGHQRFDGYIEAAGHQKILVQNQAVRNPVMFFPAEHGKAFLMVATQIDHQAVGGYVLVPVKDRGTDQAEITSASTPGDQLSETTSQDDAAVEQ